MSRSGTRLRTFLSLVRSRWSGRAGGPCWDCPLWVPRSARRTRRADVASALGSLTTMADTATAHHSAVEPVYAASTTALNAVTLSMMTELEATHIKVNLVSPGFANTALVNFEGTESVEDAAREVVRVARLGPDAPAGTFTCPAPAPCCVRQGSACRARPCFEGVLSVAGGTKARALSQRAGPVRGLRAP
ncbi:SDR family NAD(P)-dependent oxidoreductase [Streptomonospora wellingtoniae]|uniref:SDR family NAD(P)-dependent oxidoreductase n=1 Tax=Streptomonospora wellingtoniae TaxID=3075544 RepID=A0ABU2KWC3_9ACTN|nr:SDR family NAD(P)-dependent oxidoreductase [Streptomonospora sp. DSM 45055]MDT0303595.1 SDR family NAD(P)-dependent oxidoreductase [Streptomonospora sp. DSM 45055]